jgi:hypothetical protein
MIACEPSKLNITPDVFVNVPGLVRVPATRLPVALVVTKPWAFEIPPEMVNVSPFVKPEPFVRTTLATGPENYLISYQPAEAPLPEAKAVLTAKTPTAMLLTKALGVVLL